MGAKLKIGWIGSGFVGQVAHLINYRQLSQVEIVALAELRGTLGIQVCRKYEIDSFYPDHRALLADTELDAVVAIVRREHTASVALDVLNHGLHLFTEKPMAPTVAQAERLVAAAKKNRLTYVNGFMRRYDEGVQIAKTVIKEFEESGELGDIMYFRAYCFGGGDYCNIGGNVTTDEPAPRHLIWPIAPDWVPTEFEKEYESFLNVFVHDINLIRYVSGQEPRLSHVTYSKNSGTLDLEFDGYPGVFEFGHLNTNRYWEEGIEIFFSRGRIVLELPPAFLPNQPATVRIFKENRDNSTEMLSPQADWSWAFKRQAEGFVNSVLTGAKNLASGNDSINDMKFIEAVWSRII